LIVLRDGQNHDDTENTLNSVRPSQMRSSGQPADSASNDDWQTILGRNAYFIGEHGSDIDRVSLKLSVAQADFDGHQPDMAKLEDRIILSINEFQNSLY
jgi:hypothetical protein